MDYKVGDKIIVRSRPMSYKFQYTIGEIFTIKEVGVRCVYSTRLRCIDKKHVELFIPKNLIGGKLL